MVEISVNDNIMVGESDFGLVNVKNLVNFSMEKLYTSMNFVVFCNCIELVISIVLVL